MASQRLVLLKLGGSVVTFKNQPLRFNQTATNRIGRVLASLDYSLALVHGGGSFGHYYAAKHELSRITSNASRKGVAAAKAAMIELHSKILKSLQEAGLSPFTVSPVALIEASSRKWLKRHLALLIKDRMIPVTYGDVLQDEGGYRIVSGDTLMFEIAQLLKPSTVFFAMDEDGIYPDKSLSGAPIVELKADSLVLDKLLAGLKSSVLDATGGIVFKIQEARRIAELGIDVYFVNGLKPERIVKALKGGEIRGSLIKGVRR